MTSNTPLLVSLVALATGCGLAVPSANTHPEASPEPLDYQDDGIWAALPGADDPADSAPAGEVDGQASAEVDVFFVHPTTYYSGRSWNQPLDDARANALTDSAVMRNQASVFNADARVFAPRYRQATLFTFLTANRKDEARDALDNAYADVERAFDEFLARIGDRPFMVASHSQGTYHAHRLLTERVTGTPLTDRLVAAYIIGYPIAERLLADTLPDLPLCDDATATGCLVIYTTYVEDSEPRAAHDAIVHNPHGLALDPSDHTACVNPLSWRADEQGAPIVAHLGAVEYEGDERTGVVSEPLTGARCDAGLLEVESDIPGYDGLGGNLHTSDYGLFAMNLRANASARVEAYLGAR